MKSIKQLFLFFLILIVPPINAQELPPVQNFKPQDYNAQNQNWAITQAENNSIFIANNSGVLEYNGAAWSLYASPNETIIRSIKAIDDKVYTGCYMEFGYWQRNSFGELKYTSLSKKFKIKHKDDEQFWNILQIEEWILFQSLNRIYLYNIKKQSISFINSDDTIVKMYKTENGIFFQKQNVGLFKIENGKETLFLSNSILNKSRIVNIFDYNNGLLIATQNQGFFFSDKDNISPWKPELNKVFSNLSIYSCIQLKDKSFALGTISNGLIHIDNQGKVEYDINKKNGLNDNTVLSLFEDKFDNLWLGLDNGVSLINQKSPFKLYNDFDGILGSTYAAVVFKDKLYIGTNQGLFFKPKDSNEKFKLVNGTKGQVWSLNVFKNELFCGHDLGTFIVNHNTSRKISNIQGTWDIKSLNDSEDKLLQGNYDGLYVLEKINNNWRVKNKVEGLNISSRYFEVFDTVIYVNHEYKGVFELTVDENFSSVKKTNKLSETKELNSSLIKYNNELYYSYKKGVFKYHFSENKFKKDSLLSTIYNNNFISGKLVKIKNSNELWAFSNENIHQISPSKLSNKLKINKIPLTNSLRKGIVGYENILKLDSDNYLLCSASGYIKINLNTLKQKDFSVQISRVAKANYNKHAPESSLDMLAEQSLEHNQNSVGFFYYTTNFDKYLKTFYQYKLEGMYNDWSDWSTKSEEFFEKLPFGDYKFLVRAKKGDKISKNIAEFDFNIKKPWYKTNLMYLLYAILTLLAFFLIHTRYKKHYKKQQESLIQKNKKEIALQQAQNEKEIIRIKNEKLKEDFNTKSKELATSIMSVVKKNELLTDIKKQLSAIDSPNTKLVVQLIDKSLKQNDDWAFFQEAFNNADNQFLKKVKEKHPNLSPNDLKLCAYLRLNLSSKEIAPLFSISVKSVEIKRYRLRKKMDLSHENNLVDYILKM